MVEGGGTYTAYVHEYMQFYEPCVTINRHFWKLEYLEAEYYPDHWYHKEAAVVDPNWTWGKVGDKTTFSWHLSGSLNNKAISADGYGYGHGYRQHHWGKGGKGFGEHGLPNLAWALAWEGHAGLHFFTRFPKGVVNPFIYALPEGFTITRKWYGQNGDHWTTTHDVRCDGNHVNKRIQLLGTGFKPGSLRCGTATRTRVLGSSRAIPSTPSPPPRETVTSGTEAPSSLNSTTATSTAATGRWTSTSENPTPRCPILTLLSSGPRPGPPSPTTGTSMRERRLRNLPTTKLLKTRGDGICTKTGLLFHQHSVAPSAPVASLLALAPEAVLLLLASSPPSSESATTEVEVPSE